MILKLRHVGLKVTNIEKSVKFYTKMGMVVIKNLREIWSGQPIHIVKMKAADGSMLELIKADEWPETHFAVEVDTLFPALSGMGESITKKRETSEASVLYVNDPDGHSIELVRLNEG